MARRVQRCPSATFIELNVVVLLDFEYQSTYTQDSQWIYRPPFRSNVVGGGGGEEEGTRISCVFVDVIVVVSEREAGAGAAAAAAV